MELASGSLAVNKAALMETCCGTKADHSHSLLFFPPLKGSGIISTAFPYVARLGICSAVLQLRAGTCLAVSSRV